MRPIAYSILTLTIAALTSIRETWIFGIFLLLWFTGFVLHKIEKLENKIKS